MCGGLAHVIAELHGLAVVRDGRVGRGVAELAVRLKDAPGDGLDVICAELGSAAYGECFAQVGGGRVDAARQPPSSYTPATQQLHRGHTTVAQQPHSHAAVTQHAAHGTHHTTYGAAHFANPLRTRSVHPGTKVSKLAVT